MDGASIMTIAVSTEILAVPSSVMSRLAGGRTAASDAGTGLACTLPEITSLSRDTTLAAILPSCETFGNPSFWLSLIVITIWPRRTKVAVLNGAAPDPWAP